MRFKIKGSSWEFHKGMMKKRGGTEDILPPLDSGSDSGYIIHGVAYPDKPLSTPETNISVDDKDHITQRNMIPKTKKSDEVFTLNCEPKDLLDDPRVQDALRLTGFPDKLEANPICDSPSGHEFCVNCGWRSSLHPYSRDARVR